MGLLALVSGTFAVIDQNVKVVNVVVSIYIGLSV